MEGNYASTDARYRGNGLVKKGEKLKANFSTPMINKTKKKVSVSTGAREKVLNVSGGAEGKVPEGENVIELKYLLLFKSLDSKGGDTENLAEVESSLSNETRSLPDLNYGEMVQVKDQRGTNQKWWKRSEKKCREV